MDFDLVIKNGTVVTAVDTFRADIGMQGGKIHTIAAEIPAHKGNLVDAKNKLVIPGGIDPHTHLDMPFGGTTSADDFESGTIAAAFGGTTSIVDFAIQKKGGSTLEALEEWHKKAAGKAAIDYGFHMIITDLPEERVPEMKKLVKEGVTSYKMFMAYPGVLYVDDGVIFRAMRQAGSDGSVICMHAENGIVIDEIVKAAVKAGKKDPKWHALTRPTRMEGEGVHRAISIAEVAGVPVYIVHLSSSDALEQVTLARNRGVHAFAETCPQYLFLDYSYYEKKGFEGAKWVMTPALREKWNQDRLWRGLQFGDLTSISTDHCPFCFKGQKELGKSSFAKIPNGAPGVENRMSLMYNGGVVGGKITLNKFVEITSTNAAKMFGMWPRKGTIAVGSDADVVVFDPNRKETISFKRKHTHHMRADYSAYEGFKVQGWTDTVIARGKIIIKDGKFLGKKGDGAFIKRGLYSGIYPKPLTPDFGQ